MKILVAFLALAIAASSGRSVRFMWMPGGDGKLHLVDLGKTPVKGRAVSDGDVTFHLYTSSNPSSSNLINIGDPSSLGPFKPSKKTKLIIHGWESSESHMREVIDGWLAQEDSNNIAVDWSGPAGNIDYTQAKEDTVAVGQYVADLVDFLVSQGASLSNIEIAGHSLGAHVSGIAGHRTSSGSVAKIVGMDPAGVLYGGTGSADHLDASDANFVEVIHTNGGLLGWVDPLGHADFYPNGGSSQPGCGLDLAGTCSHSRSHAYFAESATSSRFVGRQCDSYDDFSSGACDGNPSAVMGELTRSGTQGVFFLNTNGDPPYAQG